MGSLKSAIGDRAMLTVGEPQSYGWVDMVELVDLAMVMKRSLCNASGFKRAGTGWNETSATNCTGNSSIAGTDT